eukprot:IDg23487t1
MDLPPPPTDLEAVVLADLQHGASAGVYRDDADDDDAASDAAASAESTHHNSSDEYPLDNHSGPDLDALTTAPLSHRLCACPPGTCLDVLPGAKALSESFAEMDQSTRRSPSKRRRMERHAHAATDNAVSLQSRPRNRSNTVYSFRGQFAGEIASSATLVFEDRRSARRADKIGLQRTLVKKFIKQFGLSHGLENPTGRHARGGTPAIVLPIGYTKGK